MSALFCFLSEIMMAKFAPSPAFQTDRLVARPMTMGDVPAFYAAANDWDVARMTGTFPWPFTLAVARARIRSMQRMDPAREIVFALIKEGPGRRHFAGAIGVHGKGVPSQHFILGYHIARPFWGQGLATEAASGILKWAVGRWGGYITIEASHYTDNPASGRILQKLGFEKAGPPAPLFCRARNARVPSQKLLWRPPGRSC